MCSQGYYLRSSLDEIGFRLPLGHAGKHCPITTQYGQCNEPNVNYINSHERVYVRTGPITVVDITGVHTVSVIWCTCTACDEDPMQLLSLGLYPATYDRPATAFTFRALDDFLLANKISGIAAQSYFERLRRLTDPAFPDDVPVSLGHSDLMISSDRT